MMRLRLATTRDLHRLTEITTTSLIDDPTYDYMWPKRKVYPEDNFFWWQLKLERHLYDQNSTVLVAEIDGQEDSKGAEKRPGPAALIISYGVWERFGCNKAARQRFAAKNTWMNALDSKLFLGSHCTRMLCVPCRWRTRAFLSLLSWSAAKNPPGTAARVTR